MLTLLSACTYELVALDPLQLGDPLLPEVSSPPLVEQPAGWTMAVWMAGDNALERQIDDLIDELESAKIEGVNIVAQIDRSPGNAEGGGDWSGGRRYEILEDTRPGPISKLVEVLGDVDTGDGASLSEFLLWANARYPADRFALLFWNYAGGYWISSDDTSSEIEKSRIYLHDGELSSALSAVVEARGDKIDLITLDACNMGEWEVAATIEAQAKVMVASQAWVGDKGYAYDLVFEELPADADAMLVAERFAYSAVYNGELTHAAIDLAKEPALSDAIDRLAGAMLVEEGGLDAFISARSAARALEPSWDDHWIDIGQFADRVAEENTGELALAAAALRETLDASIISNYRAEDLSFASGLSILAETAHPAWFDRYGMGLWAETRWNELLEAVSEYE